jgi:threonine/homoserine/homoserine lactone efflux protein
MLLAALVGFVFGFVGSMPVAGPVSVMVCLFAVDGRARRGVALAAGCGVAEGGYAALAFGGFAALLAHYPVLGPISRALAAALLFGVGVALLRFRVRANDSPVPDNGVKRSALLGFTVTALNPTILATWSAAAGVLLSTGLVARELVFAVPFGVGAALGVFVWFALLVYLLQRLRRELSTRVVRWGARVTGVLLLGLALWIAVRLVADLC